LSLAREAGTILAWDEGDNLILVDLRGESLLSTRAPARIQAGALSDDGSLVAALVDGGRLMLMDRELEPLTERAAPAEPAGLTIDPHGRYLAVPTRNGSNFLFNRFGKPAGRFDTIQPLAHLRFVPDRPMMVAASAYGTLFGLEVAGDRSGNLTTEVLWEQRILSNVGRLAVTGDGGMVLASCFTHGVQRYDARGHNEGAYHLGGTASHAVPDFAGRTIAVATTEGELSILNQAGNVRWKTALPRAPVALECDALGRFVLYGLPTGEITRIDLEGVKPGAAEGRAPAVRTGSGSSGRPGSVRSPAWTVPVAQSDDQAATAVLAVLDQPLRIGVMNNRNRLQVFTGSGGALGQAPELMGVGRILRTATGWIAAATDRQIVLYDARRNGAQRLDLSLVEVTHLVPRPDTFGVAIVQERDRIGRASLSGRWVWKRELRSPVEDLAVGPEALTAVTTDDGQFLIFDPAGEPAGQYAADPVEPLNLVAAPAGSPPSVAWITLARRFQVLRGHRQDGRVVWESPIPWEAWQLHAIEGLVIVTAPDGRALAYDGTGHQRAQSRAEASLGVFFAGPDGEAWRVAAQGVHLICTDLFGRVNWRSIAEEPIGPLAASRSGVAAVLGRSLAWFPSPESPGG
jgi:hypothetical protein